MIERILERVTDRLPGRLIVGPDGGPYMERYHLTTFAGVTVFLQRFVASDPDRGLHDHPWNWAFSLILKGFYWEETIVGDEVKWIRRRWFNFIRGSKFHRIRKPPLIPCIWTLFVHGRRAKMWGFAEPVMDRENNTVAGYVYHKYRGLVSDDSWQRDRKTIGVYIKAYRELYK